MLSNEFYGDYGVTLTLVEHPENDALPNMVEVLNDLLQPPDKVDAMVAHMSR